MDTVAQEAARYGQGYQLVFAGYARFVLELGLGRYREAYHSLDGQIGDTSQLKFALADMVEAAARCGEPGAAHEMLGRLTGLAATSPVPRTLGDLARARALLAGTEAGADTGAERLYLEAIDHHEQTRGPAHRARSHQVYGEWLRRERRARQARHHLRTARELFSAMGATAFAARAAQELSAAGEKVTAPAPGRPGAQVHDLTSQEARVAHLAAAGATNAEIASQLYLSANTVDYHLRKVFRKLGVNSRRQLHDATW
jgi:DNA-binding CsgD family transcriptional regulator